MYKHVRKLPPWTISEEVTWGWMSLKQKDSTKKRKTWDPPRNYQSPDYLLRWVYIGAESGRLWKRCHRGEKETMMSLLQRSKYNPSALFGSCSEQHVHNKVIKLGIFQLLESNHNQDRQDDYKIWLKTDKMIIEYSYSKMNNKSNCLQ